MNEWLTEIDAYVAPIAQVATDYHAGFVILMYSLIPVVAKILGSLEGVRRLPEMAGLSLILMVTFTPFCLLWLYQGFFHPDRIPRAGDWIIDYCRNGANMWGLFAFMEGLLVWMFFYSLKYHRR